MSPRIVFVAIAVVCAVLAAACDDDEPVASAPDNTRAAAQRTPTANPSVIRSFTGGSATASVTVAGQRYEYEGGECTVGPEDAYISVNIGDVGGDHYFGLLAGRSPAADDDTRSTAGGGDFTGSDVLITIVARGNNFLLRSADTTLTLPPDLNSGSFTSLEATNSAEVDGEFSC
jgi:hypothetical protein